MKSSLRPSLSRSPSWAPHAHPASVMTPSAPCWKRPSSGRKLSRRLLPWNRYPRTEMLVTKASSRPRFSTSPSVADMPLLESLSRRSEEHTSELQSRLHLVCRLLLEKKKKEQRETRPKRPETGGASV